LKFYLNFNHFHHSNKKGNCLKPIDNTTLD